MPEYNINGLDAFFDHQGSPLESTLAPTQDQAALPREGAKIHERGCVSHLMVGQSGRKLIGNIGERRDTGGSDDAAGANDFPVVAMGFELTINAANAIDVQALHVDVLALTEPFGVVAKRFDGYRLRGGSRDTPLLEKSLERVDS
jgi:hypothetical protein